MVGDGARYAKVSETGMPWYLGPPDSGKKRSCSSGPSETAALDVKFERDIELLDI